MTAEKVIFWENGSKAGGARVGRVFRFVGQDIHRKLKKLRGTELLAVNISVK